MERTINIDINGQFVRKDNKNAGVMGESNVTTLHITMDDTWRGYGKRIVWRNANGENPVSAVLFDVDSLPSDPLVYDTAIPSEPMEIPGWCSFTIEGYSEDGDVHKVAFSVSDRLYVAEADSFSKLSEPSPSETQQIFEALGKAEESVRASATEAKSWAVGGTGSRPGEDTDNSKYYAGKAEKSAAEAAGSEQSAEQSATSAGASATAAASSAGAAASSAAAASQSAASAGESASNASESERTAAASESAAADSAAEAKKSEQSAAKSASSASESAEDAENSVKRYPYINQTSKTWFVWDSSKESFVDTGIVAEGKNGIEADGLWGTHIDDDGFLVVTYTGDSPPPLSINEAGELVYSLADGQEVNVGKVTGTGGGAYTIGAGLKLDRDTNTLSVDTADRVEADNSKPVTSAAVFVTVGNIESLLETI